MLEGVADGLVQDQGERGRDVDGQLQRLGRIDLAGYVLAGGEVEVARHLAADAINIVGRKRRNRHGVPRLAAIWTAV